MIYWISLESLAKELRYSSRLTEKGLLEITKKVKPITLTHVSRRITELLDEDLIYIKKSTKKGKVYDMTRKVKILNLEKELKKEIQARLRWISLNLKHQYVHEFGT